MEWKHPDYYKKMKRDFLKEADKEQKKLDESYKESLKQTEKRKDLTNKNKSDKENYYEKI